jgi:hypothetical protein
MLQEIQNVYASWVSYFCVIIRTKKKMSIRELDEHLGLGYEAKTIKKVADFGRLLQELKKTEIPSEVIRDINMEVTKVNAFSGSAKGLRRQIEVSQIAILSHLESNLGIVSKHYYQNLWMVFGIIIGVVFSAFFDLAGYDDTWNSMGFTISMGMLFGMLAGKNRDIQAKKTGHQLSF